VTISLKGGPHAIKPPAHADNATGVKTDIPACRCTGRTFASFELIEAGWHEHRRRSYHLPDAGAMTDAPRSEPTAAGPARQAVTTVDGEIHHHQPGHADPDGNVARQYVIAFIDGESGHRELPVHPVGVVVLQIAHQLVMAGGQAESNPADLAGGDPFARTCRAA
jgi:hypothetical protein